MSKRNILKIIFYASGGFILLGIIFAIFVLTGNFYVTKKTFISDNKKYKIIIKGNGPKWPFGDEDIVVYAKNKWITFRFKIQIANNGKNLDDFNYRVEWKKDSAYLTLFGEEQDDEDLIIDFKNKTIKHRKINYEVIKVDEEIENEYFEGILGKSELISHNIRILDENGLDILPYNIETFIRTLKYEQEEGITEIKWYGKGSATVYKNSDITLIDCPYDYNSRNDEEYKNVPYNSHRYIIASSSYEYNYDLCIAK